MIIHAIETSKGKYVNFILPDQDPGAWREVEALGGNVAWRQDLHCWVASMKEAAYARFILKREFDRG
jgi:hypothetical protein